MARFGRPVRNLVKVGWGWEVVVVMGGVGQRGAVQLEGEEFVRRLLVERPSAVALG